MTLILLLLLQQPPAIEEAKSATVEQGPYAQLTVSRTGKFVVIGRSDRLEILSAEDLTLVRDLKGPWTGIGFDEKDEHLLVVDGDLIRIDTKEWKEKGRELLDGIELLRPKVLLQRHGVPTFKPRQAYIADDESVYYRSKGGGVSRAMRKDGKLVAERLTSGAPEEDYKIEGIVGRIEKTPLLLLVAGRAGILYQERAYFLIASSGTVMGAPCGDLVAFVGGPYEGLYDPKTWKVREHRPPSGRVGDEDPSRHDAVVDPRSGWVLVAEEAGLRAWNTKDFARESRYQELHEPCLKLALDAANRVLYTLQEEKLRRWKLKD
jgi:hypothetical protein